MDPIKLLVVAVLIAILASLGSALYYLVTDDQGQTRNMARALTVRIGLSVALFILLFIAWAAGLIEPHGLRP